MKRGGAYRSARQPAAGCARFDQLLPGTESTALKRAEVMEAIAGRIAVGLAGLFQALGYHLPGGVLIVGALFFFCFATHTNRAVIDDRQDSTVSGFQRFVAPAAFFRT
jgi:hypothetical protein